MSPLRVFLWRRRRPLAALYLVVLLIAVGVVYGYARYVPDSIDTGLTVAVRSTFWHDTFREVQRARIDFDKSQNATDPAERTRLLRNARQRVEMFLGEHPSVQPDRLYTQAIVAATELLSEIHIARGKPSRAARVLEALADRVPLNYRLRQLEAEAKVAAGDLGGAADAFRDSFKLALNHPDVAESYLEVLAELARFEDVVWVADQFERAVRRGAPSVELKVGPARSGLQRRVLDLSGVPVEHGSYSRSVTFYNLGRGARSTVSSPPDLLADWDSGGPLFVQLRFESVYEQLEVLEFRYWTRDGKRSTLVLGADSVRTFHRPHSGVEYYVEIRTDLDPSTVARFEVDYRTPTQKLSSDAEAIVAKARANLGGGR